MNIGKSKKSRENTSRSENKSDGSDGNGSESNLTILESEDLEEIDKALGLWDKLPIAQREFFELMGITPLSYKQIGSRLLGIALGGEDRDSLRAIEMFMSYFSPEEGRRMNSGGGPGNQLNLLISGLNARLQSD